MSSYPSVIPWLEPKQDSAHRRSSFQIRHATFLNYFQEMAASIPRASTVWSPSEITSLIEIWKQPDIQNQLRGRVRNDQIYEVISKRMYHYGFNKRGGQCLQKLKHLKAEWRKIREHNSTPGNQQQTWCFFDAMSPVMLHEQQLSQNPVNWADWRVDSSSTAGFSENGFPASPSLRSEPDPNPEAVAYQDETIELDHMSPECSTPLPDVSETPAQDSSAAQQQKETKKRRRRRGRQPQQPPPLLSAILASCLQTCLKEYLSHNARMLQQQIEAQERHDEREWLARERCEERERLAKERREERERSAQERREKRDREHELGMMELFVKSQAQMLQAFVGKLPHVGNNVGQEIVSCVGTQTSVDVRSD